MSNKIVTESNFKIGDKVIRGRDWAWADQDKDSIYGVINSDSGRGWVEVKWVNHKGLTVNTQTYEVGPHTFDLYFYE